MRITRCNAQFLDLRLSPREAAALVLVLRGLPLFRRRYFTQLITLLEQVTLDAFRQWSLPNEQVTLVKLRNGALLHLAKQDIPFTSAAWPPRLVPGRPTDQRSGETSDIEMQRLYGLAAVAPGEEAAWELCADAVGDVSEEDSEAGKGEEWISQ